MRVRVGRNLAAFPLPAAIAAGESAIMCPSPLNVH